MNNLTKLDILELKKLNKYNKRNLKKIENSYPVQYIIGYVNFFGLKIKVNKHVLIPRFETEYLIEKLLGYIKKYNFVSPKILDMCTGSGCIGLTLKSSIPNSTVTLTDISSSSLKVAKDNSKNLNLDVEILKSDLFKNVMDKDYDIFVSNPPYVMINEPVPEILSYEPSIAFYSGPKGINHIEKILDNVFNYVKKKSIIALEINEKSEEAITKILEKKGITNYEFQKDLAGKTRYLFIFNNCE